MVPPGDPIALSVIVPAFNEERRVAATLGTLCDYLRQRPWDWEIRLVDDGSRDQTARIGDRFASTEPRVIVQREPHRGKGGAVKAGLVAASRGRNGFSSLSRPANKISLLEIYKAVEAPPVFSIHEYPKEKTCRTSCTHKEAMVELLEDAQRALETRLGQRKLSEMVAKARRYK